MTFRSPNDPYRDELKYHMGHLWGPDGSVSALCFKRPRAINLEHALWTITRDAVTCKKCLRMLKESSSA